MNMEYLRFMSINVETIMSSCEKEANLSCEKEANLSYGEETNAFWRAVFVAAFTGTSFEGVLSANSTPQKNPNVPPACDDSGQ